MRFPRRPQRQQGLLALSFLLFLQVQVQAQEAFILPTANRALFSGEYPRFYMAVARNREGVQYDTWQGGMFGLVRTPVVDQGTVFFRQFHEGLDIRPLRRDPAGEPLDDVWSTGDGTVVHVNDNPRQSNYGRYIVVEHPLSDGPYYSLYAHLMRTDVSIGQSVRAGTVLGRLGYSGNVPSKASAHVHFEMNILLHKRFNVWQVGSEVAPENPHGIYNGLNLTGLNIADLLLDQRSESNLRVRDFITRQPTYYTVAFPKEGSEIDLLERYPWLLTEDSPESNAWEMDMQAEGLPQAIRGASHPGITDITLLHVTASPYFHTYQTRKHLSGKGPVGAPGTAKLSGTGLRYLKLLTGRF